MNKNMHRIIFNKNRGQMMAVGETAAAQCGAAGGETVPGSRTGLLVTLTPLKFALLAALGMVLWQQPSAHAQIVADPGAAANQRATVLQTGNGVPQVNIQTPSAAGVSRNTYSQFDVQRSGAILNNSRTSTATQLGGYVQGNPWLATGTARVVLNEVNSSNPSQLRGYVEVAGQRAEVIIANPAGIAIDGAGFINASRVTLTTGTPIMSGGNLDGYRVQGGNLTVNGQGLDARDADYTGILARAVQVNAGIWARELKVVIGANQIDAAQAAIAPIAGAGAAPAFSLDVAQLGGMYAGKIFLLGTEAGLGVRNAGTIVATGGNFILQANGWLTNSGTLQAQGQAQIQTSGTGPNTANITNSGTIDSSDELQINSAQVLDNSGGSISAPRLDIAAASLVNRSGSIEQTGSQALNLQSFGLSNTAGGKIGEAAPSTATVSANGAAAKVYATGVIAVNGALGNDAGRINAAGPIMVASQGGLNNDGGTLNLQQLQVTGGNVSNNSGSVRTQGDVLIQAGQLNNQSGSMTVGGQLQITASGVDNRLGNMVQNSLSDSNVAVTGNLDNTGGRIASNGQNLTLTTQGLVNTDGKIEHAGSMALVIGTGAAALTGQRGQITSNGSLSIKAGDITLDGATTSAGQITIDAANLSNRSGTLTQTGTGQTRISVSSPTGLIDNTAGTVSTAGDLVLTAASLVNAQGGITATQKAVVTASNSFDNTDGQLVSSQSLGITGNTTGHVVNTRGTLQASGDSVTFNGGDFNNSTGKVFAATDVNLHVSSLGNAAGGSLYATGQQTIVATGAVSNAGVLGAQGNVTINAISLTSATGSVLAAGIKADHSLATSGNLNLNTAQALAVNGQISAVGDITLAGNSVSLVGSQAGAANITASASSGDLSTASAVVSTRGTLALTANAQASQTLNNNGGILSAGQLVINAANLSNQSGQITQTGTADTALAVATASGVQGALDNTQGRITTAAQNFTLGAQTITNTSGSIEHAGPSAASGLTLGALTVNASTLDNASGTLSGNGSLLVNASNVGNSSGTMKAAVDARLYASAQIDNASGNISAGRDLTLSAGQLVNPGTVSAGRDTSISLQGDFTNSAAGIRANRNLAVATTGNFVNTASLQAANDLTINAANIVNDNADQSSSLMAGGKLSTQSATLYNSSSIIGAQVTLAASQSITNAGPKALIGATDVNGKLELLAPYIYNRDDTTSTDTAPQTGILGLGAVVLAGSKDAGGNYTAAAQVLNQSASIESGKDLTVVANVLTNTRRILTVGAGYTDTGSFTGSGVWSLTTTSVPGGRYIEPAHGGSMNADYVNTSYTTTTARNAVEQISPEARLLAGADFTPGVALLQNYWSKVSAAGNISLNGVTLDQDSWRGAASPSERSTSSGTYNYRIYTGARYSLAWGPEVLYAAVPGYESSFTAGGALGGSGNTIINGAGGAGLPGIYAQAAAGNVAGLLTLPAGNLYTSNSAGSTAFLVQTNPAFAATRPWQGSDFYLRQLGLDPGTAPRRLGDNFYEQELVKSQMLALTGKAVTDNYAGAQAQFEQMFARGAANARALGLAGIQPGISLTPAQVAALTGDVIMLEEREVDVPVNGTTTKQKVLVPIVYLASVKPGDLQASGVLISAANIKLAATQGFNNAGTIQSRGNLSIAMTQNAILNNRGGTLKAGQLNIDFGKNLILATAAQDRASVGPLGTRVQTDLGRIASIEVIGNAAIKTAKNFEQTGAQLKAGGDLTADIGGSYILGAVQRTDSLDAAFALKGASGTSSSKLIQNTLSGVQVGGATLIKTGHDFTSQGAGIDSQGGGQISAGGNITLAAVKDSLTTQSQS